jgi:uncharacterized protein YcfJ
MPRPFPLCLAAMLALAMPAAHAQAIANTRVDYAQVLRVEPVYEVRTVQAVDPDCLRPNRPRASIGTAIGACRPRTTPVRTIVAYDVEYSYKGDTYMSRMKSDPGSRVRVRVSVTPVDDARPVSVAPSGSR